MVFSAAEGGGLQSDNWRTEELDMIYQLARNAEV